LKCFLVARRLFEVLTPYLADLLPDGDGGGAGARLPERGRVAGRGEVADVVRRLRVARQLVLAADRAPHAVLAGADKRPALVKKAS
jgi:hypothetical protein